MRDTCPLSRTTFRYSIFVFLEDCMTTLVCWIIHHLQRKSQLNICYLTLSYKKEVEVVPNVELWAGLMSLWGHLFTWYLSTPLVNSKWPHSGFISTVFIFFLRPVCFGNDHVRRSNNNMGEKIVFWTREAFLRSGPIKTLNLLIKLNHSIMQ